MAHILKFFPRQVLVGAGSSGQTIYSEVFEVSNFKEILVEFNVPGILQPLSPAIGISAIIQTTNDPAFNNAIWSQLGTALTRTSVGISSSAYSDPMRFVRGTIVMPSSYVATVLFEGVARNSE